MGWDQQIERASYRGVAFDCQAADDDLSRRLAEHVYPYRNGSDFEDLGRAARTTRLRAVFLGVEYLADLGAFLQVVDAGKKGLFQHPLMGSWQARCRRFPVHHEHAFRDAAFVEVEFVEDGTDASLPDLFSVGVAQEDVLVACDDIIAEASKLDQAIDGVADLVADAQDFANSVTSAVQDAVNRVNMVRAAVLKAVAIAKKIGDPASWPLVSACKRLVRSALQLGRAVQSLSPPVVLHNLATNMSLTMLAHGLYGDGNRAEQLRRLNRVRNPFMVQAGSQLKVYGR